MVDLFGLREFTWELFKTLTIGGTLTGIPLYYYLKQNSPHSIENLMHELKITNSKNQVPLVINEQEKEYGKNYVFHVPEGLCLEDFTKEHKKEKLQHVLDGEIKLENIGNMNVLMKVITQKLEKQYEYKYEKLPLMKFFIGYSYMGKEYLTLSNDDVSMLIGGGTGKGKSSLLRLLITQMILNNYNMIDLYLCDLARKEFSMFEKCKYVKKIAYDEKDTLEILYTLKQIIEERSKEFKDGINSIYKYNKKYSNNKWKFIVCFIDEFADITLTPNKKVNTQMQLLLSELERKGRAVGVHFGLSTQHPNAETVPSIIKKHLFIRFAFSCSDRFASDAIIDHYGAEDIKATGRAIMKNSEGEVEVQTAFLDEDECIKLIEHTFIYKEGKDKIETIGVKRNGTSGKR
jgi:hypothetical protein